MSIKLERAIPLIFVFALLLLVLIGGATYYSMIRTQESLGWESHTQEVLLRMEKLQSSLVDVETSARGFVLSGQETFMEPFFPGSRQFHEELQHLRTLTGDNAIQQEQLATLQRLGESKIVLAQKFIDLRRSSGLEDALEAVKAGEGKAVMDQIRVLIKNLQQEEIQLLAKRRAALQTQLSRTIAAILTSSLLGIISLAYANFIIVRQLKRRRLTELALAEANGLLEKRVETQSENLSKTSGELQLENVRRAVAEKNEREQREWWRVTLESIGDCVITTDTEGKINFINQKAQHITGWTEQDAAGLPLENVFIIVNETSLQPVESPIVKVLTEGVIVGLANHTSLLTKDGRYLPIDDCGAPIRDNEGNIIGAVLVFRDFSQQRQAEMQLQNAEEQQRLALEAGKMGTFTWDIPTNSLQIDDRIRELFGIPDDVEIDSADPLLAVVHADDRPALDQNLKDALEKKAPYDARFRVNLPDGTLRWIAGLGTAEFDAAGKTTFLRGINYDITDQVETEEKVRESEERYRLIAETASDAIITIDKSSTILFINRAAERIFGFNIAEMIGQSLTMLMPEYLRHLHEAGITRYETTRQRHVNWEHLEIPGLHREGHEIPLELSFSESRLHGRHVYIGIARDVSERRKAEMERSELLAREQLLRARAEEASNLKDEFVATVSHELRTPLNAILGWTRMMRAGTLDSLTTGKALETIERSAENQARLIDDLLDVSRIITGKLRLDISTIDPAIFVQAALETVRPAANAKEITIQADLDKHTNFIAGDVTRLQQVAWNLFSNAIKFTPKGGQIKVGLTRSDSHVLLSVSDNGQGIPAEFLPHVFDRFRQADATSIRKHGGLGLGLAIARHLVELHGGLITVASGGQDQGANFTVRLPIKALQLSASESSPPPNSQTVPASEALAALNAEPMLQGLAILIVDDESDARQLLEQILTTYGATVLTADSAASALEIIQQQQPDLLVSDIGMPDEDGYALIRQVREYQQGQLRRLPAIALTAYARPRDRMQALAAGFNHHVPKPVEPAELITVIASLTGRLNLSDS